MSNRKNESGTPAVETVEVNPTRAELQRQMDEAREAISETVSEIKGVVAHQYDEVKDKYDSVRDGIGEVLDWREQFQENPVVWGAGAVSVGILIGIGLAHAFEDSHTSKRRGGNSGVSALGSHLVGEVAGLADAVLPTLTGKVKEMFGVDLSAYLPGKVEPPPARQLGAKKRATSKKIGAKKSSAKKKALARKPK